MDQCTHEVRAEYWKGIIEACLNRLAGQAAKSWLRMESQSRVIITGIENFVNRLMKS